MDPGGVSQMSKSQSKNFRKNVPLTPNPSIPGYYFENFFGSNPLKIVNQPPPPDTNQPPPYTILGHVLFLLLDVNRKKRRAGQTQHQNPTPAA